MFNLNLIKYVFFLILTANDKILIYIYEIIISFFNDLLSL